MSSGKGHSIDCDKDDMDMEGRVFERVFGQMRRNYASTRSAAAAIFALVRCYQKPNKREVGTAK